MSIPCDKGYCLRITGTGSGFHKHFTEPNKVKHPITENFSLSSLYLIAPGEDTLRRKSENTLVYCAPHMLKDSVVFTFPTSLEIACHTKIYFVIAVTNLVLSDMQVISFTLNSKNLKKCGKHKGNNFLIAGKLKNSQILC